MTFYYTYNDSPEPGTSPGAMTLCPAALAQQAAHYRQQAQHYDSAATAVDTDPASSFRGRRTHAAAGRAAQALREHFRSCAAHSDQIAQRFTDTSRAIAEADHHNARSFVPGTTPGAAPGAAQ